MEELIQFFIEELIEDINTIDFTCTKSFQNQKEKEITIMNSQEARKYSAFIQHRTHALGEMIQFFLEEQDEIGPIEQRVNNYIKEVFVGLIEKINTIDFTSDDYADFDEDINTIDSISEDYADYDKGPPYWKN